ncbi:MAG: biotin/lipoyl-binding protein [Myxococcales bacterium]|nr:biotin/lipoyl-binding protein [Myxococcales bacterium]
MPDEKKAEVGAVITNLLVANRGEIAVRVIRSAQARGLQTTAIYSEADAGSPHVAAADRAVPIGPAPVGESYLNVARVLAAAKAAGADAVHPGYGLLSENAEFARACDAAGLIFVGPDPTSIELMADKRAAREAALAADVPCIPGFEGGDGSEAAFVAAAAEIGYPVMIKAAAGGGGRGMRRAGDEAELKQALPLAAREAEAAFGDGRLLLERAVEHARHVEVQVMADRHGNAIHLGERDCSVQRRFQKVLEECPSPAVDSTLRDRMGEAALKLVRAAKYVGAGTVEFLLGPDGSFYFLEMNTRLQVEHPVTELVTGLDLVALQLSVADGERLPLTQEDITLTGHAIEARLYAEDPAADFMPQTGRIEHWSTPQVAGLRVDHALRDGLEVSAHYDPMLAKVIAHGEGRAEALRRLDAGLRGLRLLGPRHNRDFLRRVIGDAAFASGEVDTGWLGRDGEGLLAEPAPEPATWAVAALALLLADTDSRDHGERLGFFNARPIRLPFDLVCGDHVQQVALRCERDRFEVEVGDDTLTLTAPRRDPERGELRLVCDGVQRVFGLHLDGDAVQLDDGRRFDLRDRTRAPAGEADGAGSGRIASPMEGAVVEVRCAKGDRVSRGDVLLVIEAMKLQHNVLADVDGEVRAIGVGQGDQVAIGQLLLEIDAEGD